MTRQALVTGGTGAVGSAVVRALVARGVPTTFTWHRSRDVAEALAAHGGVAAAAMAAAHAGGGVRVNVVALGLLDAGQGARASEEARAAWRRFSAARREGTPAQAAAVIAWLLLEDRAMNGRVLAANGGL